MSEGEEKEDIRPLLLSTSWINHQIIYLRAQSARAPALLCLRVVHKSQIPTHQQQIVIGIPFMSHQMPYLPQQRRAPSGWTGGQNLLTSLSPWKKLAPLWIHKGWLPFVNLNIKRNWHGAPWLLKADSHSFYQAGVWWSIIKDPSLVTLSRRWNWGFGGLWWWGYIFLWWTWMGEIQWRRESEYYLHKINSSKEWVRTPIKLVNWLSMVCPWIYNTTTLFILGLDREDSPICMGVLNVINNHNGTCIFNRPEMGFFNIHKGQTIAYDIKLSITR